MTTIYMNPEHYGLRLVGVVDWMDDGYEFDLTAVWKDIESGNRYVADDAGNSQWLPFDNVDRGGLTLLMSVRNLEDHLRRRDESHVRNGRRSRVEEIRALVRKTREASK